MRGLVWETPEEIDLALAQRLRQIRKRRRITQQRLSELSGVSYAVIRKFEATGKISLVSLTKIALGLDCGDEIRSLFTSVPYRNIEEVINEQKDN